jgi:hypothetical protein
MLAGLCGHHMKHIFEILGIHLPVPLTFWTEEISQVVLENISVALRTVHTISRLISSAILGILSIIIQGSMLFTKMPVIRLEN